jgi:hypothetical protein
MNLFYFFINWFVGTPTKTHIVIIGLWGHKPKPQTKTTNQNHKPKLQTKTQPFAHSCISGQTIRNNPSCFLAPSRQPIRTNQSPQKIFANSCISGNPSAPILRVSLRLRAFVATHPHQSIPTKKYSQIRAFVATTLLYKFQFYVPPYYFSFPYTYLRY